MVVMKVKVKVKVVVVKGGKSDGKGRKELGGKESSDGGHDVEWKIMVVVVVVKVVKAVVIVVVVVVEMVIVVVKVVVKVKVMVMVQGAKSLEERSRVAVDMLLS